MASTQRTESGKWTCRVYIGMKDGKKQYKRFTAETKKEAERIANTYAINIPQKKEGFELTVKEAMTAYIESKENVLSPSTVEGYKKIPRLRLQSIMKVKLCDLTEEMIQYAINIDAATLSPKSVRNAVGFLTASLGMFGYKDINVTLPQKKKKEITIPTDEEMRLICDSALGYGIVLEVHLAAYMGLRRSEISAIDIATDIDLSNKTIKIDKAMVRSDSGKYVLKGTKTTSSTRILAIPQIIFPLVEEAVLSGRKMQNPNYIEKQFCRMRNELGLKHINFHSLRHYFASTLVVLNVPDFYAMKLMGHSSDQMLKNVYQHIRKDYLQDVADKMDDFFADKSKRMTKG